MNQRRSDRQLGCRNVKLEGDVYFFQSSTSSNHARDNVAAGLFALCQLQGTYADMFIDVLVLACFARQRVNRNVPTCVNILMHCCHTISCGASIMLTSAPNSPP